MNDHLELDICFDKYNYHDSLHLHPWEGHSQKNWVGLSCLLPKTLTLFMTKISNFPYPIDDLTRNLIHYLWPLQLAQLL